MSIQAPKGTQDVLPSQSHQWLWMEEAIRNACALAGFEQIRTPVFEHTELFARGVGDTTDIVQKEMYTFLDKGGRSITLKPEGTAGCVRALIESGLLSGALPVKVYYLNSPTFRYEQPQAGRLREHHQFGVEVFGAQDSACDAELIALGVSLLTQLGAQGLHVNINSIGCNACRPQYLNTLQEALTQKSNDLCPTCVDRTTRNPLRVLDCKVPSCQAAISQLPSIVDSLCPDCATHFAAVQEYLTALGIDYRVNPRIVRGLDYYNRTVFEIISDHLGAQSTVCGGGRYDGLVKQLGGPQTPAAGFGLGMDRLLLLLQNQGTNWPQKPLLDVYVAKADDKAHLAAFSLVHALRKAGIRADMDACGRGLKAQFKYAGKISVPFVAIIGEDELQNNMITLRDMNNQSQQTMTVEDCILKLLSCVKEEYHG